MSLFPLNTQESAPEESKPLLADVNKQFGFVPNLIGIMSTSPKLTQAYLQVSQIFQNTSLTPTEQQIVLLTVSRFHGCHYCVAAHSAIASMQQVDSAIVDAIRNDQVISDNKLQALRHFTHQLIENRGWLEEKAIHDFLAAGYEAEQVLEILVGVAQKMLSNFTNHLANTPLDSVFEPVAWSG